MAPFRFATPDQTTEPAALAAIAGPVRALERTPLRTVGFTEARHERLALTLASGERRTLVVKRTRLAADWTARRTGDTRGREAAMLAEPALGAIWEAFACPYLAFAAADGEIALVMEDLSAHLFPDVRSPLGDDEEERLLGALATLHARFWASPALALPWLARPEQFASVLDARGTADPDARAALPDALRSSVTDGWAAAVQRLPPRVARVVTAPATDLEWLWDGLPRTLLHGDAKVANFALRPDRRVAAFDWAWLGAGPATVDVGWYLAVNATRLARTKEALLARYRALLTTRLAEPLPDALWERLVRAGLVVGARMLLWSKALAVAAGRPGAGAEWAWWTERLDAACE